MNLLTVKCRRRSAELTRHNFAKTIGVRSALPSLCVYQAARFVQVALIESVSSLRTLTGNSLIHFSNRDHFAGFAKHALQVGHGADSGD